jgi:hypothetical protein
MFEMEIVQKKGTSCRRLDIMNICLSNSNDDDGSAKRNNGMCVLDFESGLGIHIVLEREVAHFVVACRPG